MPDQAGAISPAIYGQDISRFLDFAWPSSGNYIDIQSTFDVGSQSLTPETKHAIEIRVPGTYTFYALYRSTTGVYTAYIQFYKNGSPYDVAGSTLSTSYQTYTRDIPVVAGDLIEWRLWVANVAETSNMARYDIWKLYSKKISTPWLQFLLEG